PSRPPTSDAPHKEHLAYSLLRLSQVAAREAYRLDSTEDMDELLDDNSVGSISVDVWNRYQDVCDMLWETCASKTTSPMVDKSDCARPPEAQSLPHTNRGAHVTLPPAAPSPLGPHFSVSTKTTLPLTMALSPPVVSKLNELPHRSTKLSHRARKTPYPPGPLTPFRSSGWAKPDPMPPPPSPAPCSSKSLGDTPAAGVRCAAPPSRSPWDDYATSSSGFSFRCPRS
ncbi:hypothetical protein BD310DRAFT_810407, partial [Dichomitus squalens]